MARVAVVGHVEWVEFLRVGHVPAPGEILHVRERWEDPGGGGAVAAVQLAKLAGEATFFTALAQDAMGSATVERLAGERVAVHAGRRPAPQRRAVTFLDDAAERTIVVIGERIVPHGADELPWGRLAEFDGVYFTGGDVGALRAARAARVLVATPRAEDTLRAAGVRLDALVHSGGDPGEALDPATLDPPPDLVVSTLGERGGRWVAAEGRTGTWEVAPLPGPPVDAYGCGDSFAAGLTYALAAGEAPADAVLLAARCGAACLTGAGPYAAQLRLA